MNRSQVFLLLGAVVLLLILVFGFKTRSAYAPQSSEKAQEENFDIKLDEQDQTVVDSLRQAFPNDSISFLKACASYMANKTKWAKSALFAKKVAEKENTPLSWSMAGTTSIIAIKESQNPAERASLASWATSFLKKAQAMEPNNIEHRINEALVYVEHSESGPMKGIQMLLELEKEHPESVPVQIQLAQLAMRSGQYDKARARLDKVLVWEPNNKRAALLLRSLESMIK